MNRVEMFKNKMKKGLETKEQKHEFYYEMSKLSLMVILTMMWLTWGFVPSMSYIEGYENAKKWDPRLALLAIGGAVAPFPFTLSFLPRWIAYPIFKQIGWIGIKPVLPKGWNKKQKEKPVNHE